MAKRFKFGLYQPHLWTLDDAQRWWRACDEAGFDMIGVPDSPVFLREMFVSATCCVLSTAQARIFTAVTNPVTRHPSVTAAGLIALNDLAPGRIVLGIAAGDSALWTVGLKPAPVAQLREYIVAVKALLRGEAAHWQGQTFSAQWDKWSPPLDIPIYVACAGPKTLQMAAEVADGVVAYVGFAADDITRAQRAIADGLAAAGRKSDEFDVWWNAQVFFAPSIEEAKETTLGWSPQWLTEGTLAGKGIPEEYHDALREMNADTHDIDAIYKTPERPRILVERAKRLGLYDWLISRAPGLWGTPDDVAARFEAYFDAGMSNWTIFVGGNEADRFEFVETLAKQVVPRLESM
jgi:5,10-methylenetetrahydromethanopterin reductase